MTYDPSSSPLPRHVRLKQVLHALQISKSSLYAKLNPKSPYFDPTFVKPFYLPKSRIPLWAAAELAAWLEAAQSSQVATPGQDSSGDSSAQPPKSVLGALAESAVLAGLNTSLDAKTPSPKQTTMTRNGKQVTIELRRRHVALHQPGT